MNKTHHKQLDVVAHDGENHGLHLAGKLVTATADDINTLSTSGVLIDYEAGSSTDELLATIQLPDGGIKAVEVIISDKEDGNELTSTAASGNLTAVDGTILEVVTAKKHIRAFTDSTGKLTLSLVDDAHTVDQRFCVITASGSLIVGRASVAGDYEGG